MASSTPLVFQVIDWYERDECGQLIVSAFGRTAEGEVINANITGFKPGFLLKLGGKMTATKLSGTIREISRSHAGKSGLAGAVVQKKDFMYYSECEERFLSVKFDSIRDFVSTRSRFNKHADYKAALYDSKNPPFIQMIHARDLPTSGWLSLEAYEEEEHESIENRRTVTVDWTAVSRCTDPPAAMAPLTVAAFDIECTSSHGDFPVPIKGYEKTAREIVIWVTDQSKSRPLVQVVDDLCAMFLAAFTDTKTDGAAISNVFVNDAVAVTEDKYRTYIENDIGNILSTKKANTEKIESIAGLLNMCSNRHILPKLRGDVMCQIGLTVNRVGCTSVDKYVFVVGGCDPVPDTETHAYKTEEAMLRGFVRRFLQVDPDIVTGYNIMGFDFMYIYKRALEISKDLAEHLEMGRIEPQRDERSPVYVEHRLSSSALGDNDLKYLHMPGRLLIDLMKVVQRDHKLDSYTLNSVATHFIGDAKDDITPGDIFRLNGGSDADRATIAKYCVQDCALCNRLCEKLSTVAGSFGMAGVCSVPTSWIFLRGQGAKVLSLVSVQCLRDNYAIPLLGGQAKTSKYEGALVLNPKTGIYLDDPVVVLDFSSLYPSSMIATNMSHDTLVPPGERGRSMVQTLGLETSDVTFDEENAHGVRVAKTVRFVKTKRLGILPRILQYLLSQRAATRALIKTCGDPFERGVLDGLQLAYKLTANSLYGQLGASTSPICCVDIAASTTAVGRGMITQLKNFVEQDFGGEVVYGDTDSCFITFPKLCVDSATGDKLAGQAAVARCIELGKECSREFQKQIPEPQCAEYEKTFAPFLLLSKKRYCGLRFENDAAAEPTQSSMGIVMKRRDNAGIVKDVYGGVLDCILKDRNIVAAADFVRSSLADLVEGRTPVERLIISKTLKSSYVNPDSIVHAALAKRMRDRDPGSAPSINDRVPYVFVVTNTPKAIQADRVEDPGYAAAHNLRIDYAHYITNQIMVPIQQVFALVVADLPGARTVGLTPEDSSDDAKKVALKNRDSEVVRLLFQPSLDAVAHSRSSMRDMRSFFGV